MLISTATMDNTMEVPQKIKKIELLYNLVIPLLVV